MRLLLAITSEAGEAAARAAASPLLSLRLAKAGVYMNTPR